MSHQAETFTFPQKINWFQGALDFFCIQEISGWPDNFGEKFYNWSLNQNINNIKTLSLFSGGGGLDIAFHDMGFNIFECVELEKKFANSITLNSTNGKRLEGCNVVCQDIRDYTTNEKNIDFIIGGPPCQTFSAAGARASGVNGIDDKRGTLFEEYVRILIKTNPKAFLFENVYRIIGAQNGKPWELIQKSFKDAGYNLFWRILDSADYGVPQHRERLIIVGVKTMDDFLFPMPTHGPDSADKKPYYNAGNAVLGIDTSSCKVGITGRHGYLLNDIPPGLNYSFYTEKMGHPKPIFGWRSKFSDYLYKADPNTPVRTIKAQGGQYTGPFSWENRPFTVEELKRLQTIPDNYDLSGNRQTAIHQIGNSVPPQLGRIMALSILNQIFGINLPFEIQYLNPSQKLGFRTRKSSLTAIYKDKASNFIDNNLSPDNSKKYTEEEGSISLYINKEFSLTEKKHENAKKYLFSYKVNNEKWIFQCTRKNFNGEENFSISIKLSSHHKKTLHTKEIFLISFDSEPLSILAVWKFLERELSRLAHKDDLIQLFGHYKSKQPCTMEFHSLKNNDYFWKVFSKVTKGLCIGETLDINHISERYQVSTENFKKAMVILKNNGFEIRNHNTNKQIPYNHYLIPYQFPTLNERSLQRLTTL